MAAGPYVSAEARNGEANFPFRRRESTEIRIFKFHLIISIPISFHWIVQNSIFI